MIGEELVFAVWVKVGVVERRLGAAGAKGMAALPSSVSSRWILLKLRRRFSCVKVVVPTAPRVKPRGSVLVRPFFKLQQHDLGFRSDPQGRTPGADAVAGIDLKIAEALQPVAKTSVDP